ncbi:MAG TPA: inner membrane CreD family protein [Candidatus Anaerobiospirillum pullistercoris]|uniref:Inner membrane CreD family protein n=1 Tax=Candidatus Anaerobiospirillum pullistercoris TaxID=2838452 RepID=A0A9D2B080_9GAMM|nr:inner membrane CreD family protein [Candidatus Anaerobiospirillum pullistercoris]
MCSQDHKPDSAVPTPLSDPIVSANSKDAVAGAGASTAASTSTNTAAATDVSGSAAAQTTANNTANANANAGSGQGTRPSSFQPAPNHNYQWQSQGSGSHQGNGQGAPYYGYQGYAQQGAAQGAAQGAYASAQAAQAAQAAQVAAVRAAMTTKSKYSETLGFHILMVAIISLLLLIPTIFFSLVLDDRKSNEYSAISSMVSAWGDEQILNDIELGISVEKFTSYERDADGNIISSNYISQRMLVTPVHASNDIIVDTEKRYRGNYEASLYSLIVTQQARFDLQQVIQTLTNLNGIESVDRGGVFLLFTVSDTKGINEVKQLVINNKSFTPEPADKYNGFMVRLSMADVSAILHGEELPQNRSDVFADVSDEELELEPVPALRNSFDAEKEAASYDESTVAVVGRNQLAETADHGFKGKDLGLGLKGETAPAGVMVVEATYLVRGSQKLTFNPLGQVSELAISGQGVVPSFAGDFLPREREVDSSKLTFSANYYQNNLSTGHSKIMEDDYSTDLKGFAIDLSDTSESYILIDRLTKYVLLVIAMTYVAVLAFEISAQRMVSLVQYVVIGAALILFYMVLLALSEHTSFTIAYLVAALLMSSMIALYLKAVLASKRDALCVFLLLLAIYAVLFAIVHIEAYALLVGTVLLVIMLGIIMFITRKLNAHGLSKILS